MIEDLSKILSWEAKFHPGNVNITLRPGFKRIHSVVWVVPGFMFTDLYKSSKILTVQNSLEIVCQCWGMMIELFDWTFCKPLGETLLLKHATALLLFLFLGFIFCAASALFSAHVVESSATNPSFAPSKLRNMHALLKGKASVVYRLPRHCSSGLYEGRVWALNPSRKQTARDSDSQETPAVRFGSSNRK